MRSLVSAHALAGSSCGVRGVAALPVRLGARRRCPAPPCRVTNTSDEIYKQLKLKQLGDEDEWVQVNDMQVLYPELGSLEGRVTAQFLDEMLGGKGPDLEETAYWFHTPEGQGPGRAGCCCMAVCTPDVGWLAECGNRLSYGL